MPSAEILCPRNIICLHRKLHFEGFSFSPCSWKCLNMACNWRRWSSSIFEYTITSPRYTRAKVRFNSPRQFCISLWNVAGALHNPYTIQRNSYTPRLPTVKAVYCRDFSNIRTCQIPDFTSILEKNQAPTMDSMVSCMWGRGNQSFLVLALSLRKSIQNWRVLSFLRMRTMALHQGDFNGRIAPPSSMSCRFSQTSSSKGKAIHQNRSLKGSSSINLMMCSAVSVQPISFLSSEKMW